VKSTSASLRDANQPLAATHAAWLVDLDGTLYRAAWVRAMMAAELALCGPWHIRALARFRREQERLRHESEAGARSPFELQVSCAAAALGCPEEHLTKTVAEWMERRPGKWLRLFRHRRLARDIENFRRTGGRTALVSDYPGTVKLRALGMIELFEVRVCNGEPGGPSQLKPSPQGYLLAAERLGIAPRQCLVIGDRRDTDGEAAKRAGMGLRKV
jgi:HAD superfamily hydrolase (TIGR01549 family)